MPISGERLEGRHYVARLLVACQVLASPAGRAAAWLWASPHLNKSPVSPVTRPRHTISPLAIRSSKVLTMMPSGSEVASSAISFRTVLKNFLASGGWNSIFLNE